ncbi:hypothetical protein GCM10009128_20230 [Psychrosphaera haliotis]|uniref:hypothetical protein n=1 Tax=Psychrosphaera haliotis TaxID=555083 RepID=UPI0031D9C364
MVSDNGALSYIKERYNEEILRFESIENKCTRFLTIITIIIASFGAILGYQNSQLFNPKNPIEYITLSAGLLAIFSLACAFGHLLLSLKINSSIVVPRGTQTSEWLKNQESEPAQSYIYDCYSNAVVKQSDFNSDKLKPLKLAYEELVIAAWLISVFAILKVITEMMKC